MFSWDREKGKESDYRITDDEDDKWHATIFFLLRWIKNTLLPFDTHTHTCRHQMVYSWLLAYSILNAHERDGKKNEYNKGANNDDGSHFLFVHAQQ
jgi:hypothetical protein